MTRTLTRLLALSLGLATLASACGGPAPARRHEGPDVVTAEWTSGDDAVIAPSDAGAP